MTVSVKLAFQSLTDGDTATRIRQIALKEGLEPSSLILSVTAAALDTEQAKALETLARLRVDGFGLAIDDFGSGPMALDQLSLVARVNSGAALLTCFQGTRCHAWPCQSLGPHNQLTTCYRSTAVDLEGRGATPSH